MKIRPVGDDVLHAGGHDEGRVQLKCDGTR